MTGTRRIAVAFAVVAVASCANVNARLTEGRQLSAQGNWRRAFEVFGEVRSRTCSVLTIDDRCHEAIVGQADAKLHLGEIQGSYWMLVRSQSGLFPGRLVDVRFEAVQKEAQRALGSRLARRPGSATVRVSFESNTTASFTPQAAVLTLDLTPIPLVGLNDTKVGPVRAATATTVISPGEHELEMGTKYASGGRLPPGYSIWVNDRKKIEVADGDALEIDVRFSEKPSWRSSADAVETTIQVRPGTPAR